MKLNAYSLLDMKAGAFAVPFFMHHDAQAIRAVIELGQDMSTTVGRYPSDFALCRVGGFDDQSGGLVPLPVPENLGTIAALLPAPRAELPLFNKESLSQVVTRPNGQVPGFDPNGEVM